MDSKIIRKLANRIDEWGCVTSAMQMVPLADSTGFSIFITNKAIFGEMFAESGKWLHELTGLKLYVNDLPRCRDEFGKRIAGRLFERFQPYVRDGSRLYKLSWSSHTEEYKWAPHTDFIPVLTWNAESGRHPIASRIRVQVPDKHILQAVDAYVRPINRALRVHAIMRGWEPAPRWNPLRWSSTELVAKNFRERVPPHATAMDVLELREREHATYGMGHVSRALELVNTMSVANALDAIPVRYVPWLEVIDG